MVVASTAGNVVEREFRGLMADRPVKVCDYSGFPWWHALLVSPGHETKSADMLERIRVFAYLPRFVVHLRAPHGRRRAVMRAVVPGMLFAPVEMMDIRRREEVFDLCHVRGYVQTSDGSPARLRKIDIETIREMEAKLYVPPPPDPTDLWAGEVGDPVRFRNEVLAERWRNCTVGNIERYPHVGVEAEFFNSRRMIWTTASEIETDSRDHEVPQLWVLVPSAPKGATRDF